VVAHRSEFKNGRGGRLAEVIGRRQPGNRAA